MVSRTRPIQRSGWKWIVCLSVAVTLFASAALPAGAGHSPGSAAGSAITASPRATPQAYSPADSPVAPTTRPAAADAPELLRAIPAADIIPASATPQAYPPADSPAAIPPSVLPPPAVAGGRVVWMEVTAYCGCKKCCGPNAHGITASGHPISFNHAHFIAADTSVLPFFTQVIIPGYADEQPVPVIDRGSAIKGNHIDVFFPEHQTAVDWGKRWIAVTLLPE
ncbi:MAG TPA: 3D domain-containing protein [Tepidisphaeraceae bacterium]|jgi:3D (Asp-Asp-Asp) domain-containing protein|nr:3D domain-containing protein [Tepidisphaeraceae bacterium]